MTQPPNPPKLTETEFNILRGNVQQRWIQDNIEVSKAWYEEVWYFMHRKGILKEESDAVK